MWSLLKVNFISYFSLSSASSSVRRVLEFDSGMNNLILYKHDGKLHPDVVFATQKRQQERESAEEDGYGMGNPPCSEGLRDPSLLLRRSRPDVVTGCGTCMGTSNVRAEGSSVPRGKRTHWQNAAAKQPCTREIRFQTEAT